MKEIVPFLHAIHLTVSCLTRKACIDGHCHYNSNPFSQRAGISGGPMYFPEPADIVCNPREQTVYTGLVSRSQTQTSDPSV